MIESEQGPAELANEATGRLLTRIDAFPRWFTLLAETVKLELKFVDKVNKELVLLDQFLECLPRYGWFVAHDILDRALWLVLVVKEQSIFLDDDRE